MFSSCRHLLRSNLRQRGGKNIDFYHLRQLHSCFTFLRWIDWAIEQSHTITFNIPYVFGLSPSFEVNFEATWRTKYWFLPSETITFLFYIFEMNWLSYITVSYNHFEHSICFRVVALFWGQLWGHVEDKILIFTIWDNYIPVLHFWDELIEL
jgi:hypothetical protein